MTCTEWRHTYMAGGETLWVCWCKRWGIFEKEGRRKVKHKVKKPQKSENARKTAEVVLPNSKKKVWVCCVCYPASLGVVWCLSYCPQVTLLRARGSTSEKVNFLERVFCVVTCWWKAVFLHVHTSSPCAYAVLLSFCKISECVWSRGVSTFRRNHSLGQDFLE